MNNLIKGCDFVILRGRLDKVFPW